MSVRYFSLWNISRQLRDVAVVRKFHVHRRHVADVTARDHIQRAIACRHIGQRWRCFRRRRGFEIRLGRRRRNFNFNDACDRRLLHDDHLRFLLIRNGVRNVNHARVAVPPPSIVIVAAARRRDALPLPRRQLRPFPRGRFHLLPRRALTPFTLNRGKGRRRRQTDSRKGPTVLRARRQRQEENTKNEAESAHNLPPARLVLANQDDVSIVPQSTTLRLPRRIWPPPATIRPGKRPPPPAHPAGAASGTETTVLHRSGRA